jgi:L-fuculose-phosphate aldolase
MIATGATLGKAMWAAVELETLARQYYHAALAGGVVILPDEEIERVRAKIATYGHQAPAERIAKA